MARNEEKAQSMLYRFREAQAAELGIQIRRQERRPRIPSSVKNVKAAEKWRGQVVQEISRKVARIQDFGLTDFEVRDMNDDINKLMREKEKWEQQIANLGGPRWSRSRYVLDDSGSEVPGGRGYKYFGRAKDLPGVKELLSKQVETAEEREDKQYSHYRQYYHQTPAYYGLEDDQDPKLLANEQAQEKKDWDTRTGILLVELGYEPEEVESMFNGDQPGPFPMPRSDAHIVPASTHHQKGSRKNAAAQDAEAMAVHDPDANEDFKSQVADYLFALPPDQLRPPTLPSKEHMDNWLLRAHKEALRAECTLSHAQLLSLLSLHTDSMSPPFRPSMTT